MASKVINVVLFSVVLFLILESNTMVMAHGSHGDAKEADGGAAAKNATNATTAGQVVGATDSSYKDQSGVMGAGLGAGAPAK